MAYESYLEWLAAETATTWWNDSADPEEIRRGLAMGMTGVTTNPVLSYRAIHGALEEWAETLRRICDELEPEERAEALTRQVVVQTAAELRPVYDATGGELGYVCGQVDPALAADSRAMLHQARRFADWAPNVAVKLPVTNAGLETLEECTAQGITVTATVSFTVPQVIAVAERHRRGRARALEADVRPGHCFAVIMAGRLDDYLRDVANDRGAGIAEADIRWAGVAASKRAYRLYRERDYRAVLLIAAMRGPYHITELAGADVVMSVPPKIQDALRQENPPREERYDEPVPDGVVDRLSALSEFVRAYEPDGMAPEEFITYGVVQRTLTQFSLVGWDMLAVLGADQA
jgi:transaldolase